MRNSFIGSLWFAAGLIAATALAQAQSAAEDWKVILGPAVIYGPEFEGADKYDVKPVPYVDIRYRELFFASYRDGIGFNVLNAHGFKAGPLVKFDFGRDEDDSNALTGLGDVDFGVELGGFVEYMPVPFLVAKVELRQAVSGHDGFVGDASLNFRARLGERGFLLAGPSISYGDDRYMERYFGISAAQSAASGYAAFDADAGFKSASFNAIAGYAVTEDVSLVAFGGYKRLLEDAADSPLVEGDGGSADQFFAGAAITYRFGF